MIFGKEISSRKYFEKKLRKYCKSFFNECKELFKDESVSVDKEKLSIKNSKYAEKITGSIRDYYYDSFNFSVRHLENIAPLSIVPVRRYLSKNSDNFSSKYVDKRLKETFDSIDKTTLKAVDKFKERVSGVKKEIAIDLFNDSLLSLFESVFSEKRAELIALVESQSAENTAALDVIKETKIQYKTWNTMQDDFVEEECIANEKQGPIPVDEAFSSGEYAPPNHINCRCWIDVYFVNDDKES